MKRAFKSARLHETATQVALIKPRGEEPPPSPPPTRMNQLLVAAAPLMCPVEDFGGLTPLKSHKSRRRCRFIFSLRRLNQSVNWCVN